MGAAASKERRSQDGEHESREANPVFDGVGDPD